MLCIVWAVQESLRDDPNSHSYVQSSVMSYSNTGNGAPKVYQATSATRQAPGGVSQTNNCVCFMSEFVGELVPFRTCCVNVAKCLLLLVAETFVLTYFCRWNFELLLTGTFTPKSKNDMELAPKSKYW